MPTTRARAEALLRRIRSSLSAAYQAVCWVFGAAIGFVKRQWQNASLRRLRRRREKEAYDRLLSAMGVNAHTHAGSESELLARKRIESIAQSMANSSPMGVAGPEEEDFPDPPASKTAISEYLQPTKKERSRNTEKNLILPQEPKGTRSRVTLPKEEILRAEALSDAATDLFHPGTPKPRKSEVKKIDTQVAGFWEQNPNASEEVQLAARMPIVHNQIRTIIQHLITSRPTIQGPPDLVEPIRQWFEVEMELNTDFERGIDRFVADIAKQMLYYGSAALIKQRSQSTQLQPYTDPVRKARRSPVWGYAIPDMATVEAFIDARGRVRKWRQEPHLFKDGKAKEYSARDVFLARLPTENSSLYFWTPSYVMSALYSASVLQELHQTIESHTEDLINFRLYATVGSKDYRNGYVSDPMLDSVATTIKTSKRGATPIFPYFVDLHQIELESHISDLKEAKEIWEQEVRRGVGGSQLQDGVGDSATRNTSDTLVEKEMRAAQAIVSEIQRAFRWLTIDKLWEMDINPKDLKSHEDLPSLEFEEIDMTQQIRRETHYVQLFQSDGYTHGEFRKAIGKDVDTEREDKYYSDIQLELAEAQAEKDGEIKQEIEKQKAKVKSQTTPGGKPRPKRKND